MSLDRLHTNERRIISKVISGLLADGFEVAVSGDGQTIDCERTTNRKAIAAEVGACDETYLLAWNADSTDGPADGFVWFIHGNGNEGCDVLTDYSVNLEPQVSPASELAGRLER